jgi:putative NADH-flavin reductase
MRLTIFGATGGTGRCLVDQALAAGHEVTAVVRDPARLPVPPGPQLSVVTADVFASAEIGLAVTGADAVLTALGPRGSGPATVQRDSLRSITKAMRAAGVRRLIAVSGTIVADDGDGPLLSLLIKPLFRATFLRHVCADMRDGEAEVRGSGLDWTIVRAPALTDQPATGHYRRATDRNVARGLRLSRADLAGCLLAVAADPATIRHCVCAAN